MAQATARDTDDVESIIEDIREQQDTIKHCRIALTAMRAIETHDTTKTEDQLNQIIEKALTETRRGIDKLEDHLEDEE